jgi:membrane-bound ClpP family serine protease
MELCNWPVQDSEAAFTDGEKITVLEVKGLTLRVEKKEARLGQINKKEDS